MLVPIEWLGQYVGLPARVTGAQVAADLVRVGLEEEGLRGGEITGPLVVGRVLTKEPEPQKNGKVVNWCTVDVGEANGTGEPQGIVCGAHNFEVGDLVVVVLPGAVLPGDFAISARKTYGHLSAGMICASDELGLPDDGSGGIIRLAERLGTDDLTPGADAIALLGLDRETVEVNVTPDRGYCLSLRGVAREYAASTGADFTDPALEPAGRAAAVPAGGHPVTLDEAGTAGEPTGCDRFVARVVRGIDPARATPAWMQTRLSEAGMRPISLSVDITNYVMLALGQPLHAYDLDTLTGEAIVVRRASAGEKLTTLDDVERLLDEQDLVITDGGARVLGLAGVMGGADSEIGPTTRDVLIEAAHFDPIGIARTSRRHRLPSEASRRFERGVDPRLQAAAAQLAVDLLVEFGGGVADAAGTDVDRTRGLEPIDLDPQLPTRLVGVDYSREQVVRILTLIGCTVQDGAAGRLSVRPPSWRPDLRTGPDLVEEVARIDGYDRIPSVLPTPPGGRGLTQQQQVRRLVATVLAARGLNEVLSPPFVGAEVFDAFGYDAADERRRAVRLVNPLSETQPLLRTSLLASLVEVVQRNVTRGTKDVALFEIGQVTTGTQGAAPTFDVGVHPEPEQLQAVLDAVPEQPRHLGFVLSGAAERAGWWGAGRPVDLSDAVEVVVALGEALHVPLRIRRGSEAPFHPGRSARIELPDGTVLGAVGELHPKVVTALKLPARTVAGEVDLDRLTLAARPTPQASTLNHHPAAHSDVALVVGEEISAADVEQALRDGAGELIESITLFDTYVGDQLEAGRRSLAYRMVFRAPDRTLTTDEVNDLRDAAVASAAREHGAVQRG